MLIEAHLLKSVIEVIFNYIIPMEKNDYYLTTDLMW